MKIFFLLYVLVFSVFGSSFLMPNEAFKPYAKVNASQDIITGITLGKGIYLYEDALKIKLLQGDGLQVKNIEAPLAVDHHDAKVFLDSPEFIVHLQKEDGVRGIKKVILALSYQGCSDAGLCYEPTTKEFTLSIDTAKLGEQKTLQPLSLKPLEVDKKQQSSQVVLKKELSQTDAIANTIKNGSLLLILATFFIFGILLSLTPCVFPMIPIISGLIISQGEGLSTKKAFMLSVVYVLAMAVAYTIAGVLAGLFGANLQAALQTPWVVYSFAAIFVVLAFSMFGFYELKLPDAFVAKVSSKSDRGGFVGVAIMGFLSALIVGPCVAAPLAGALVYIGQTGDALLGGSALFVMSIGMGLPLIVVGVSAGKFMPRPGAWMTLVNATFGVMMLGVAVWMLEKILSFDVIMLLYGMLGVGFSLYLGVFEKEGHIFKRTVAVLMFIYSLALVIGFLGGSQSMLKPLSFMQNLGNATTKEVSKALDFKVIHSQKELDALLAQNKGKKILLDFSAQWCTACKELEEKTLSDLQVQNALKNYVLIRADVTNNTQEEKTLSKNYGVFGPPVVMFFNEKGELQKAKTVVGFVEPKEFLKHLL